MGAGSSVVAGLTSDDSKALLEKLSSETALFDEAVKLDASDTNRSNVLFSRLSMKVADKIMETNQHLRYWRRHTSNLLLHGRVVVASLHLL